MLLAVNGGRYLFILNCTKTLPIKTAYKTMEILPLELFDPLGKHKALFQMSLQSQP